MSPYDTVLHPDFVLPMIPRGQVLEAYSIALKDQHIAAVLPLSLIHI